MSTFPPNQMHHFGVAAATLFAIRPSPFSHPMGMFTCTLEPQHYESLRASLFLVLFLAYRLGFASCSYHRGIRSEQSLHALARSCSSHTSDVNSGGYARSNLSICLVHYLDFSASQPVIRRVLSCLSLQSTVISASTPASVSAPALHGQKTDICDSFYD